MARARAKDSNCYESPPARMLAGVSPSATFTLPWSSFDRNNPSESPLLKMPKRAHGTARAPIFTDRQLVQYRQLAAWCHRVADLDDSALQASYDEPLGLPAAGRSSAQGKSDKRLNAAAILPKLSASPKRNAAGATDEPGLFEPPPDLQELPRSRHAKREAVSPNDPMDLESFNQQFAPPATDSRKASKDPQTTDASNETAPPDAPLPSADPPAKGRVRRLPVVPEP